MFDGKPIIGIAGGIGAGKSTVAKLFADIGCLVISSDQMVTMAYSDPIIRQTLVKWWGPALLTADGEIDRKAVARKVFSNDKDRRMLEKLIHPRVNLERDKLMRNASRDPAVKAFVWDSPLLFETGLNRLCDRVVFVEVPTAVRLERVQKSRGWTEAEFIQRENLQMPLDKKREISHYVISNTTDADDLRHQVQTTLTRIIEESLC